MPATPADLFAYLDRLGIAHQTVSHPPLFTVEDARALRGNIAGGHTKNLFLKDKRDAIFLVVALEDAADQPEDAAYPGRCRTLLVRVGRPPARDLGRGAGGRDAVRRHQ